jgi:hypothetical protein
MLADFQTLIDDLVREGAQWVTPEQRERAIGLALSRYSTDRPRELVADVTSVGGQALPLPTGWVSGESVLHGIETPVGLIPPATLPSSLWSIYRGPLSEEIRIAQSLLAGDVARLTFTASHLLSDTDDTIPASHREAVACYAASLLAEQVATMHANNSDPTIGADRSDQSHPAREWASRAKSYRNRYFATLGIEINAQGVEQPRMEAAGVVVDLELPTTHGRGRLYRR